jgi:hypothetical protein
VSLSRLQQAIICVKIQERDWKTQGKCQWGEFLKETNLLVPLGQLVLKAIIMVSLFLSENNEKPTRKSINATLIGTARVMRYKDIVKVQKQRTLRKQLLKQFPRVHGIPGEDELSTGQLLPLYQV